MDHSRRIVYDLSGHPAISPNASASFALAMSPILRERESRERTDRPLGNKVVASRRGIYRDAGGMAGSKVATLFPSKTL